MNIQHRTTCPVHPGEVLADILEDTDITQTKLAELLDVSRRTVNEIILCKRSVTVDMAIRLGIVLGNGPELWLNLQQKVDLWNARNPLLEKDNYINLKSLI